MLAKRAKYDKDVQEEKKQHRFGHLGYDQDEVIRELNCENRGYNEAVFSKEYNRKMDSNREYSRVNMSPNRRN